MPWFHEKYCQEEVNFGLRHFSHCTVPRLIYNSKALKQVREEVYESIVENVGGPRYLREDVFSRFYNHIDLEVWQVLTKKKYLHLNFIGHPFLSFYFQDEEGNFAPLQDMFSSYVAIRKSILPQDSGSQMWQKFAVVVNFDGDYPLGSR